MIVDFILLVAFPAAMIYAAVSDLLTMTIPNKLSLMLVVAFLLVATASGLPWVTVAQHLGVGALVLFVCFGLFAFGWIGGGDAKLAAATALWLGSGSLVDYLLVSTIAGGLLTLMILFIRAQPLPAFALNWGWVLRLHDRNAGVPYGIALAGAALAVYPHSPIWAAISAMHS